jgi:hypothetical protein
MEYGQALETLSTLNVDGIDTVAIIEAVKGKIGSVNQEAHSLRTKYREVEGKLPLVEQYEKVTGLLKNKGFDIDNLESSLDEKFVKMNDGDNLSKLVTKLEGELAKKSGDYEKLFNDYSQKDTVIQSLQAEKQRNTIEREFSKFIDDNYYNGSFMLKSLIDSKVLSIDEEGEASFVYDKYPYKGKEAQDKLLEVFADGKKDTQKGGASTDDAQKKKQNNGDLDRFTEFAKSRASKRRF